MGRHGHRRRRFATSRSLLLAVGVPAVAAAQPAPGMEIPRSEQATPAPRYPSLAVRRDLALLGVGSALLATGALLPVHGITIPAEGLDSREIQWEVDRRIIGNRSLHASRVSDWTRNASIAFPLALTLVLSEPGHRWRDFGSRGVVYTESFLFSQGTTLMAKVAWGRPRPYAYLPADERPDDRIYDVSKARTYRSMPSGHSSSAWTGAAIAMTEELLSRPDASWMERAGVGFVGGGLAGATSTLRVEAGQHFVSDVIVGAAIGIVTGVATPLVHRGRRPLPEMKAGLQMIGGAIAGTVVGVVVAR